MFDGGPPQEVVEDQGVLVERQNDYDHQLQASIQKTQREIGFTRALGFSPFDSNGEISPLRQSLVNKTLQAFAERFSFACTTQEIARQTMPSEDSVLIDNMVITWKREFWGAHESAKTMGYRVEERYIDYLKDPKTPASS
ncbi:MAG: hypothetical protein Greene071421_543 [Parcubacteria group bacterium Greene0714_21]|nr:MAG: hypothetical protein Greene041639_553 [Parcubacteria group bacterium Greene0416_39]TSC97654.1 MAG: hypothetical protein Greene101447_401 [Parcubacteria group bacterium Greene1014_47]TSD03884.1 MAG: hypothetical protein Greene071421_543 [Parcubacteria group bacterium Greene0714_21]